MKILFSAQKDEGPFLMEWIAYHQAIGFDRILIFSNDCTDGSDDLLDELAGEGAIAHWRHTVPPDRSPQMSAARLAEDAGLFEDGDWVIWLDTDEFFLPPGGDLWRLCAEAQFDILSLPWRRMGDGGNATWPGRHVSAAFTGAARKRWRRREQVKTLFRWGHPIAGLHLHRPRLAPGTGPGDVRWIGGDGQPIDEGFWEDRDEPENMIRLRRGGDPYALGQIAHFRIRTPDMFAQKRARGDGYYAADANPVDRRDGYYHRNNLNDVEERGLLRWEADVVARMQAWMRHRDVLRAALNVPGFRWLPL